MRRWDPSARIVQIPGRYPHEPIVTALERDLPIAAGECRLAGQSRDQADDEDTGDK